MGKDNPKYLLAINCALEHKWDDAHLIVQDIDTDIAQLIHAILHKIEGDEANSSYWYSRSGLGEFDPKFDPMTELREIKKNSCNLFII